MCSYFMVGGEETQAMEFPVSQIFSACLLANPAILLGSQIMLQFSEITFLGGGVTGWLLPGLLSMAGGLIWLPSPQSVMTVEVLVFCFTLWLCVTLWSELLSPTNSVASFTPGELPPQAGLSVGVIETTGAMVRPVTLGVRMLANLAGGQMALASMESISAVGSCLLEVVETGVILIQSTIVLLLLASYVSESEVS